MPHIRAIIRWFDKHTTPHPAIVGEAQRQRAQLYVLLTLIGMMTALVSFVILLLLNPEPLMVMAALIGTPTVLLNYALSRTRFVQVAIVATMVINYLWVAATISLSPHPDYAVFILVLPMIFVSLLFSARITILATGVSMLLGFSIVTLGGRPVTFELAFAIVLILICGIGIVITNIIRERDQHKLKTRTEALERSEARYRALFTSSAVALSEEDLTISHTVIDRLRQQDVKEVDAHLHSHPEVVEEIFRGIQQVEANPAMLKLYGAKDLAEFNQHNADEFFALNRVQIANSALALCRGDSEFTYDLVDYSMQGERFECRVQWVRLNDEPPRIVVSIEDLTPVKQAERQRKELDVERERVSMLKRFLGDTTHDLLTPLTIINTSVYLGLRGQTVEQTHDRLRIIKLQAEHLETMIKDMLTMSRLDDPTETDFAFVLGDPTPYLAEIVTEFESLAQGKSQHIRYDRTDESPQLRFDRQLFGRALRNLIQNAIKYTPEGGSICVGTEVDSSHLTIHITDTGVGIPADDLPHIFDRFYRVEAHRPIDGGSGLGLAIVKKIVDAHNGEIAVTSAPDRGTTFSIRLPLAERVTSNG